MTIAVILVLAGFLSLVALLFLARERPAPPKDLAQLRKQMRVLDIEAFRNLVDVREEEFLRKNLETAQFRMVQRARLLAAAEYIVCASRNAAILHRFGEAARYSPNPSVAAAGEKLVNTAIRFRLYAFHGIARLYLAMILPGTSIRQWRIAEGYERMTTQVVLLGCLQHKQPAREMSMLHLAS
jgi:hypothetical protein